MLTQRVLLCRLFSKLLTVLFEGSKNQVSFNSITSQLLLSLFTADSLLALKIQHRASQISNENRQVQYAGEKRF